MSVPPSQSQSRLADLNDFFQALRANDVPVGPGDIARLQQLFRLEPNLDRAGLHQLLSAVLVTTPTHREVFDALFNIWCPDEETDWPQEAPLESQPNQTPGTRHQPSTPSDPEPLADVEADVTSTNSLNRRRLVGLLLGTVLGCLLAWWYWPRPLTLSSPPPETPSQVQLTPSTQDSPDDLPAIPVEHVWLWSATATPETVHHPWQLGPVELSALGLIALALAGTAGWRYWRQVRPILPIARRNIGHSWQPLPARSRDDSALISARERQQLVWNIDHFVSEDPTHRLDLSATVDATARAGGFIEMRFTPAVYDRDIWFWLDRQLDQTTPRTAIAQLRATLAAAGLEAQQGLFTDVPDRVDWPTQTGYQPAHEENQGRQALVAIFSDGERLAQRLANPLYQATTERLLRTLGLWPRLCFVDCSPTGRQLEPLLAPYGLETIALDAVPRWLGGLEQPPRNLPLGDGLHGGAQVWAAAMAIGGRQAQVHHAHNLRVQLGLPVSPWRGEQVLDAATQRPYSLINWFLRCEPRVGGGRLTPGGLVWRALAWWQQSYATAAQQMQAQENPLLPWRDSLASQRWQLEQALLRLYTDPENASRELAQLATESFEPEVRSRLSEFAAADHRAAQGETDQTYVYLTWSYDDLPVSTRHRLRRLGFANALYDEAPKPLAIPGRLALMASVLTALALTAFGVATYRWQTPDVPRFVSTDSFGNHPALARQTLRLVDHSSRGQYQVMLGSSRQQVGQMATLTSVPEGSVIPVTWQWERIASAVQIGTNKSVILRAGRLAQPIRACGDHWPQRSLLVIAAPYETSESARQLAIRWLDKGSADQVFIGLDWASHLKTWLGSSPSLNAQTQVVVILPTSTNTAQAADQLRDHPGPSAVAVSEHFATLARDLDFPGIRMIKGVSDNWQVVHTQGQVRVYGGPDRQPRSVTQLDEIQWVNICPGTFSMGSNKEADPMADSDEIVKPSRTAILSGFNMAATETTEHQYAKHFPVDGEPSQKPKAQVAWEEAQAFCNKVKGELPTEAQWEYAARGGSQFPWSFGNDEKKLEHYAWFGENAEEAQNVQMKGPNPLGLYDMHGNVWEWTQDWYGPYSSGVFVDPTGPSSSERRVLRGGSFDRTPVYLRSAFRFVVWPEYRDPFYGFRCVRVSPQP